MDETIVEQEEVELLSDYYDTVINLYQQSYEKFSELILEDVRHDEEMQKLNPCEEENNV